MPESTYEKKSTEFRREKAAGLYFEVIIMVAALFVTAALFADFLKINVYAHDSVYYVSSYLDKLKFEGRWLNYLLFPVSSKVPGLVAVFSNLLFLFLFFLLVSLRWTGRASYSVLLALLMIQCTPLMEILRWPATAIASPPLLFLAALLSPYLNVYLFYIAFGLLLYGTNSFYLLPLAHLHLLKNHQLGQNIRTLAFNILPGWGLGFLAGLVFSLLMVYLLAGQVGLQIQEWRAPSYIDSLADLLANTATSVDLLQLYIGDLFSGFWRTVLIVAAFLIGFHATNKQQYVPAAILAVAVVTAHFILVIPAGMYVSFRTAFAAWVGVLVIFFFYPDIKERQYFLLLPIVLLLMISFYRVNHQSLKWYASITNTYYDELVRISPLPPRLYKGLVFRSSSAEVKQMNDFLVRKLQLEKGRLEPLDTNLNWVPMALEAGYSNVLLCSEDQPYPVCKDEYGDDELYRAPGSGGSGIYKIYGQKNGLLIIGLNRELAFSELE